VDVVADMVNHSDGEYIWREWVTGCPIRDEEVAKRIMQSRPINSPLLHCQQRTDVEFDNCSLYVGKEQPTFTTCLPNFNEQADKTTIKSEKVL